MELSEAIAKLKQHEAEFKRLGVEHLYLFGSTARDEARDASDVDLFFDHPEGSLGLFELMDVKEAAARILGRRTDIMTRRSLHPVLRAQIEASACKCSDAYSITDRTPHRHHRGRRAYPRRIGGHDAPEPGSDKASAGWLSGGLKSSPRPPGI